LQGRMTLLLRNFMSLILLLVLAALPLGLNNSEDNVDINIEAMVITIKEFMKGLFLGDSWYYTQGDRTRLILNDIISYFISSYLYLTISAIIVVFISCIFGIFLWKKSRRWINASLGFVGMVPDFMLILILQITVVYINKNFGVKAFKVASSSVDDPAVFLPILTLTIIPLFYLVRSLAEVTSEVSAEDYILMAKSKGLSKKYIYFFHVTSNVVPYLKADLHKVLSLMIGNLFIVEYLYNTRGLTSLLFLHQIKFGYQYNLVMICLISLFILYLTCYYSLKLLLATVERCLMK